MKEQVLAVQRMQDYIEKNNAEEISLSDLARASLFSPWYSYRLFRDCLGLTPTEYIRKYRLTQAAKRLREGEVKVIDAAYDAGFTNVDTFTRAFYREFGLNPSDYVKNPVPITFFISYGAKYRDGNWIFHVVARAEPERLHEKSSSRPVLHSLRRKIS